MGRERAIRVEQSGRHLGFTLLALFASAFWLHYYLVHDLLGPLGIDELYFAHSFWLLREGVEQYSGFYSNHLPTYFWLLRPLVPPAAPDDLSFVWALRATGAAAVLTYAALLLALERRHFLFVLPFLLLFVIFGRMAEIRTDTAGLLLFNLGWWLLLRDQSRRNMLVAAACCGLALLFSARAAVMILGFAFVCAAICVRRRDIRTLGLLALVAAVFAAAMLTAFAAVPTYVQLVVQSVYLDPTDLMPDLPLWNRIVPLDRLLLLSMVAVGLAAGATQLFRGHEWERALVIAGACLTQLLLVMLDPSPFQYVYGWAMLPALAGIALLARHLVPRLHAVLALVAAGLAALILSLSLAFTLRNGRAPPTGSLLRISYDAPVGSQAFSRATTPQLLHWMVGMDRQQGLWNQLALLGEICRRIDGPALTTFYANPVCLHDARHDWAGIEWLALFEGRGSATTARELEELVTVRQPPLVAWGKQGHTPSPGALTDTLKPHYALYDGFALHRSAVTGGATADRRVIRNEAPAPKARPAS